MKQKEEPNSLALLVYYLLWTVFCFYCWAHAAFYGWNLTYEEMMLYDPIGLKTAEFLFYAIPALWLLVPCGIFSYMSAKFEKENAKKKAEAQTDVGTRADMGTWDGLL